MAAVSPRRRTGAKPCRAGTLAVLLVALGASAAAAQDRGQAATPDEERAAKVERLRAEMVNHIHLQANDLVDELVFQWVQSPPFDSPTSVVLADVIAPVGYGSGFEAEIENHLAEVLIGNPGAHVQLAHCPSCHALMVHSDKDSTIISRGVDQPRALGKLRGDSGAQFALFLDFEAEGTELVMRARVTRLTETLPIVAARTLSTKTSAPALLRSGTRLVSAEQQREEYVALLEKDGPLDFPVKLAIMGFAPSDDTALQVPTPLPTVQIGAEYAISSARAWKGSLMVGASFFPDTWTAAMAQARLMRLVTGTSTSLTHPNVYAFMGVSLGLLTGNLAQILNPPPPNPPDPPIFGPMATWIGIQGGLDVRISRRVGVAAFIEVIPTLYENDSVGDYLNSILPGAGLGVVQFNSIGGEASFSF